MNVIRIKHEDESTLQDAALLCGAKVFLESTDRSHFTFLVESKKATAVEKSLEKKGVQFERVKGAISEPEEGQGSRVTTTVAQGQLDNAPVVKKPSSCFWKLVNPFTLESEIIEDWSQVTARLEEYGAMPPTRPVYEGKVFLESNIGQLKLEAYAPPVDEVHFGEELPDEEEYVGETLFAGRQDEYPFGEASGAPMFVLREGREVAEIVVESVKRNKGDKGLGIVVGTFVIDEVLAEGNCHGRVRGRLLDARGQVTRVEGERVFEGRINPFQRLAESVGGVGESVYDKAPELMTPDEWADEFDRRTGRPIDRDSDQWRNGRVHHNLMVQAAIGEKKPVNAQAFEKYKKVSDKFPGWKLKSTEGYVKEGDNYVFRGAAAKMLTESRKLVHTVKGKANTLANVYKDSDTREFVVVFYVDGKRAHEDHDYFTDDLEDAKGTAEAEIAQFEAKKESRKRSLKEDVSGLTPDLRPKQMLDNAEGLHPSWESWGNFLEKQSLIAEHGGWKHYLAVNTNYFVSPEGEVFSGIYGYHADNVWKEIVKGNWHRDYVAARVEFAASLRKPFSAVAAEAFGIETPEGYVRERDHYVFKGSLTESTLFDAIKVGDKVTVVDRFGKERTGVARIRNRKDGVWVLNMGGAHGTPGIASEKNIVRVNGKRTLVESTDVEVGQKIPELMTPEEWTASEIAKIQARIDELPDARKIPGNLTRRRDGSGLRIASEDAKIYEKRMFLETQIEQLTAGRGQAMRGYIEPLRVAIKAKQPISAGAVDAYGIKLPEGYVREGDRYVFKGNLTESLRDHHYKIKWEHQDEFLQKAPSELYKIPREEQMRVVGIVGIKSNPTTDYLLVELDDFYKELYRGVPLRSNEYLFRFHTYRTLALNEDSRMSPLVKLNFDNWMLYFLDEEAAERDEAVFKGRGEKLRYARLVWEKFPDMDDRLQASLDGEVAKESRRFRRPFREAINRVPLKDDPDRFDAFRQMTAKNKDDEEFRAEADSLRAQAAEKRAEGQEGQAQWLEDIAADYEEFLGMSPEERKPMKLYEAREAAPGDHPRSLTELNKWFHANGVPEEVSLVRGRNYFYFTGGDTSKWDTSAVAEYRLSNLTFRRWLREYEILRDANADREPLTESTHPDIDKIGDIRSWKRVSSDRYEFASSVGKYSIFRDPETDLWYGEAPDGEPLHITRGNPYGGPEDYALEAQSDIQDWLDDQGESPLTEAGKKVSDTPFSDVMDNRLVCVKSGKVSLPDESAFEDAEEGDTVFVQGQSTKEKAYTGFMVSKDTLSGDAYTVGRAVARAALGQEKDRGEKDLKLSDMSKEEFVKWLKDQNQSGSIPVVVKKEDVVRADAKNPEKAAKNKEDKAKRKPRVVDAKDAKKAASLAKAIKNIDKEVFTKVVEKTKVEAWVFDDYKGDLRAVVREALEAWPGEYKVPRWLSEDGSNLAVWKWEKGAMKEQTAMEIMAESPGILELPEGAFADWGIGKLVDHLARIAANKGKASVSRALVNLERWNKKQNPEVSKKARRVLDRMKEE